MKQTLLVVGVVLTLLFAGGCGGMNKDEKKASKNIATQFAGPEPSKARAQIASCFADKLVSEAGIDQLTKDKILTKDLKAVKNLPKKLSKKSATAYADAIIKCYDFKKLTADLKKQSGASTAQVKAYVNCLDAIDDKDFKTAIVDDYTQSKPSATSQKVSKETQACGKKLGG